MSCPLLCKWFLINVIFKVSVEYIFWYPQFFLFLQNCSFQFRITDNASKKRIIFCCFTHYKWWLFSPNLYDTLQMLSCQCKELVLDVTKQDCLVNIFLISVDFNTFWEKINKSGSINSHLQHFPINSHQSRQKSVEVSAVFTICTTLCTVIYILSLSWIIPSFFFCE